MHWGTLCFITGNGARGVLPMWWVIHMCRGFDPLFSLWQDRARSFWGIFSHPPTPKRSFGVLKLPILKEIDLLGPKFHFSLDLFGSNFQRPAAHPHQFSDRVPTLNAAKSADQPPPGNGAHVCWNEEICGYSYIWHNTERCQIGWSILLFIFISEFILDYLFDL